MDIFFMSRSYKNHNCGVDNVQSERLTIYLAQKWRLKERLKLAALKGQ